MSRLAMLPEPAMRAAPADVPQLGRQPSSAPLPSDEWLLVEYAENGSRAAFEELVYRYERPLYNYLRHRLGDAQLAEDAFQATFLQVHLKCRQFEPGRRLRPWLYRIAINQAIDLRRRNRRHKAHSLDAASRASAQTDETPSLLDFLEDRGAGPGKRLESAEDCQRIRSAVARLPEQARQLLTLVTYQGLKYQQAADALGIPVGTIKSRMHEAVRKLHATLVAAAHRAEKTKRGPRGTVTLASCGEDKNKAGGTALVYPGRPSASEVE